MPPMDDDIDYLEEQLNELVRLFDAQKQENRELKTRVAALQAENTRLAGKVEGAIRSVGAVLESLPEA